MIGSSGDCKHVAALLLAVHSLARTDDPNELPPTARRCAWNQPTKGAMFAVDIPLHQIPFTREKLCEDSDAGASRKRSRDQPLAAQSSKGERHAFSAYSDKMRDNNVRNAPSRAAARIKLLRIVKAHLGKPSAWEVTWCPNDVPAYEN